MSASITAFPPRSAARARAARSTVSSPRRPSVPRLRHSWATLRRCAGGTVARQQAPRPGEAPTERFRFLGPGLGERFGVPLKGIPPQHHLHAIVEILGGGDIHRQPKAIQELGPKSPLLRVARADEHEARGMANAEALALKHVLPGSRHVEQEIHQVIVEEVDFVDVKKAPVRACQKSRVEGPFPWVRAFSSPKRPRPDPPSPPGADQPRAREPRRAFSHPLPGGPRRPPCPAGSQP